MLDRLHFSIGGFFDGNKDLLVWKEDGKAYRKYSEMFSGEGVTEEIDFNIYKNVSDSLETLGIQSWKKEYVDPYVLDGTQWEMEFQFEGKRKRMIYGSNDYPEKWNQLIEALGNFAPELLNETLEDEEEEEEGS